MNKYTNAPAPAAVHEGSYNELFIIQKQYHITLRILKIKLYFILYTILIMLAIAVAVIFATYLPDIAGVITPVVTLLSLLITFTTEGFILKYSKQIKKLLSTQDEMLAKLNGYQSLEEFYAKKDLFVIGDPEQGNIELDQPQELPDEQQNSNLQPDEQNLASKPALKLPVKIKAKRVFAMVMLIASMFLAIAGIAAMSTDENSIGAVMLIVGAFGILYSFFVLVTTRLLKSLMFPFIFTVILIALPIGTYFLTTQYGTTTNALSTIATTILGITLFGYILYNFYTKPQKNIREFYKLNYKLLNFVELPNAPKNANVVFNKKQDRLTIFTTDDYKIKVILEKAENDNNTSSTYILIEEKFFDVYNAQKAEYYGCKKLVELFLQQDNRTTIDFKEYDANLSHSNENIITMLDTLKQKPLLADKAYLRNYPDDFEGNYILIEFNKLLNIAIYFDNEFWHVALSNYAFSNMFKETIINYLDELIDEKYFFTQTMKAKHLNVHKMEDLPKILRSKSKKHAQVFSAVKIYR